MASLLGSPIGEIKSINAVLERKISDLQALGERLKVLNAHDAMFLIKNVFSLPKLRTAPYFQAALLTSFDDV